MTSPIIDFIEARLAEDEQQALTASPGPWHLNAEHDEVFAVDDIEVCTAFALSNNQLRNTARFIARHDPARVLREVEAKRAILAAHRPTGNDPHPGEPCTESIEHDPQGLEWEDAQNWAPCERHVKAMQERRGKPFASEHILRYLAAAWSDHPDYREEWQP